MTIKCPTKGDCTEDKRCLLRGRCINPAIVLHVAPAGTGPDEPGWQPAGTITETPHVQVTADLSVLQYQSGQWAPPIGGGPASCGG